MAIAKRWKLLIGAGIVALGAIAIPLFYLYIRGAFREEVEYNLTNVPSLEDPRFSKAIVSLSEALTTSGQMTGFWQGADAIYAARNDAIRSAQRSVRFETYYMTPGRRADEFAAALIDRANAGLTVQLLLDHQGTSSISDEYWDRLRAAGAEVRFFREFDLRAPLEYNSRTHRKLLLIDSQQLLIGGAGVSDDWDGDPDEGETAPWLEFEVRYQGPVAGLIEGSFMQNWSTTGGTVNLSADILQVQPEQGSTLYVTNDTSTLTESAMRMLFQISFLAARQRIWIASPYFIPDDNTRRTLLEARKKGVDVRVLTMGENNDKPPVYYASRERYGPLLEAGVQICEYQPSMMHAKMALIDDGWVSTGSANFDPRSFFHNDELNISTTKPQLVNQVNNFFAGALAQSNCLDNAEWQNRPLTQRIIGQFSLIFHHLL